MNANPPSAVVAVVTYGHSAESIMPALLAAVEMRANGDPLQVVVVDDHSGSAPRIPDVPTLVTAEQCGYAAAVNYVVERFPKAARYVFINPDAELDACTLRQLAWPTNDAQLVVPSIVSRDNLENIRSALTPTQALFQILAPRLATQRLGPVDLAS